MRYMNSTTGMTLPIQLHLITVLPAILLGIANILMAKGATLHKRIGVAWITLILVTSLVSFTIRSEGAYSWIHILSIITILNVILGYIGIKHGNLKMHIGCISGAFVGSFIAGIFAAILPGRFIYEWIFG